MQKWYRVPWSLQSTSTNGDSKSIAVVYHNYRTIHSDIVHYQNQETDSSMLLLTGLQTLLSFHYVLISIHLCVHISLCNFISCINLCNNCHNQDAELTHRHHWGTPRAACACATLSQTPSTPSPVFSISVLLSFSECYIHYIIKCVIFQDGLFFIKHQTLKVNPACCLYQLCAPFC